MPLVLDREVAQPRPERRRPPRRDRRRLEPALVELLRDVAADVRVEPVGALEEEAAVGRDGRVVAEQVPQHRGAAAGRVRPLDHLVELLRVADEHDVPRRRPHRERVGERDLPGLVDEEVVERAVVLASEKSQAVPAARSQSTHSSDVLDALDRARSSYYDSGLPALAFLQPAIVEPELGGRVLDDASSRLWIALWLVEATPTRLAVREQVRDQPAGRPRLARAGRPLDHEVALVEREHELLHLVEVGGLDGPVERLAAEDRLERGVAAVAGEERAAEPHQRVLLLGRAGTGSPG